jgi:hypothetical protein
MMRPPLPRAGKGRPTRGEMPPHFEVVKPKHAPTLRKVPLTGWEHGISGSSLGFLVAEEWSERPIALSDEGRAVTLSGGSRAFLGSDADDAFAPATTHSWMDISFRQLSLLDQQLSFTVDFSKVGCGCNGAVYLVAMPSTGSSHLSSGYCDIQGYDIADVTPCVELDLIEGNRKAVQATLHTQQGHGQNGRCK